MLRPGPSHALHYLPENADSLLDVGCNSGDALLHARELGVKKLFGIEINPHALEIARERLKSVPSCELFHATADQIPLSDASVDVVLCSEVLEHIPRELRQKSVREMRRVLKPEGRLILTTPAAGLFAFLDPANARLRFPSAFSALSRVVGGAGREKGYENQKHGIVWHEHFKKRELDELLTPEFEITRFRGRGALLAPVCNWLEFPFYRRKAYSHPALKAIQSAARWEMSKDFGELLAYNVLITARPSRQNGAAK